MQFRSSFAKCAAQFACLVSLFMGGSLAQISITSPPPPDQNGNPASVPMPVWMRANVSQCGGSNSLTGFGYSVGNSPFITWGKNHYAGQHTAIDNTDYRLTSPGTYTIHFKAWAQGVPNPCVADRPVTVTGPTTSENLSLEQSGNVDCSTQGPSSNWKWCHDDGTGPASETYNASSNPGVSNPSFDGDSRVFSFDYSSTRQNGVTPGRRGSRLVNEGATTLSATHLVYDAYLWFATPANVATLEMDTNYVWNNNGDILIFGLQCKSSTSAHPNGVWQYTTNQGGSTSWHDSTVACNPENWTANAWHHVQLAVHRCPTQSDPGVVCYDSVTLDGTTTNFTNAFGNYSYSRHWDPVGGIILNFQLDGDTHGGDGQTRTITAYVNGMTSIWW